MVVAQFTAHCSNPLTRHNQARINSGGWPHGLQQFPTVSNQTQILLRLSLSQTDGINNPSIQITVTDCCSPADQSISQCGAATSAAEDNHRLIVQTLQLRHFLQQPFGILLVLGTEYSAAVIAKYFTSLLTHGKHLHIGQHGPVLIQPLNPLLGGIGANKNSMIKLGKLEY